MTAKAQWELEAIEVDLLIEGVRRHYGLDLGTYSRPVLLRRLRQVLARDGYGSVSDLQASVLHAPALLERLLAALTSDPVDLFDDPPFFAAFRRNVVPWLRTHPSVRIWHAGCGSPEQLYSLAIILHEEGVLSRARIYATDASTELLAQAQSGRVPQLDSRAQSRYAASGGERALSEYFTDANGAPVLAPAIQERVFYTQHHLTNDGPFNEFHAVLCRNTILYFGRSHVNHIHGLLFESLARFGFLGLGRRESLHRTPYLRAYDEVVGAGRLYRRVS